MNFSFSIDNKDIYLSSFIYLSTYKVSEETGIYVFIHLQLKKSVLFPNST